MFLPENVERILKIIENNGAEAYVVGGCVRDWHLGKEPKDYDITTSMLPEDVMKLFKKEKYNVVPTGLQHGTVTVFPDKNGEGYEITTFRIDGEYLDGRHPSSVSFTASLEQDLSRRDLTINAMAYSPKTGLVDLYDGLKDLKEGIIRTVGDPYERINEDALRMMRAVRFSAQLGATISSDLETAIIKTSHTITQVSMERIHDELSKILMSNHPEYVEKLYQLNLLKHFLPEVNILFMVKQNNPWHLYDVGRHTMKALENTEKDLTLRLSVLLHDIGKAKAKETGEDGIDHFHGHAALSEKMAKEALRRLKFTAKEVEEVSLQCLIHDARLEPSVKAVRRFVSKYGLDERMFMIHLNVRKADNLGQNLELSSASLEQIPEILRLYEEIKNQPLSVKDLAVSGYDAMEIGYIGPDIGIELHKLLDIVLENPALNTKEYLIEEMRKDKG